jgi:hypothetical protein
MGAETNDQSHNAESGASNSDATLVSVFLDAATKRLDFQFSTDDALDSRAANVLSIGSAILPITFGLLGISGADVPLVAAIFLVLAGVAYVVLLALSWLTVSKTGSLAAGAPIGVLRRHVDGMEYSGEGLRYWVAKEYEASVSRNERILYHKVKYVGLANYALYVQSAFLSLAGVISLLFG